MAYVLEGSFTVKWLGDGVGPNPPAAQVLKVTASYSQGNAGLVPGGDAPSTANISTAAAALAVVLAAELNTNIGQIQGFATGGN